jgi:hypothetical protein
LPLVAVLDRLAKPLSMTVIFHPMRPCERGDPHDCGIKVRGIAEGFAQHEAARDCVDRDPVRKGGAQALKSRWRPVKEMLDTIWHLGSAFGPLPRDFFEHPHAVDPGDHLAAIRTSHHGQLAQRPSHLALCLHEAFEPQGCQAMTGGKNQIVIAP